MFMVLKEDIQNLVFKCEKILEANEIKAKSLKKEDKMLSKVIKGYELSNENFIIFDEIVNRHNTVKEELETIKCEEKTLKRIITKIKPLLNSLEIIEDSEPEDIEPEDIEIGQLD